MNDAPRSRRDAESVTVTEFQDLNLAPPILQALEAEGYNTPTPIQAAVIPRC